MEAKVTQTRKRVWPEKMLILILIYAHALFCAATQFSVCNFAPELVKTRNWSKLFNFYYWDIKLEAPEFVER